MCEIFEEVPWLILKLNKNKIKPHMPWGPDMVKCYLIILYDAFWFVSDNFSFLMLAGDRIYSSTEITFSVGIVNRCTVLY